MKCSLLFALALRAQVGHGFAGPAGSLALSNCFSAAAGATNGIVRRGVASTALKAAASKESGALKASETLRKTAVIEAMAERGDMTKVQAETALTAFTDVVMNNVSEGKEISLYGFGTFKGRTRKGRTGRNPRTGEEMEIKATTAPVFTASKNFKDRVKAAHTD
eukprot:g5336.t1